MSIAPFSKNLILLSVLLLALLTPAMASALDQDLKLTPEEIAWLHENRDNIRYAPNPYWPPGDYVEDGKAKGIVSDYIKIFENKLGITFKRIYYDDWNHLHHGMMTGEVDLVGAIQETREREKVFVFTQPFLTTRLAVLTRTKSPALNSLDALNSMTLAGIKGYSSLGYVRTHYPGAKIVECDDDLTALLKVSAGAVDGAVVDYMVASYLVDKYSITNIKYAKELDFRWDLRFAVNKEKAPLRSILDKVLNTISQSQRQDIYHKWVSIKLENQSGFVERHLKMAIGIFSTILFLLFVAIFFNRSLKRQVATRTRELEASTQKLRESKEYLQAVLDSAGDAVIVTDADTGKILDVNQRMTDMFGYAHAEALELDFAMLSQGEAPFSRTEALEWLRKTREAGPQTFDWLSRHQDGHTFWGEIKISFAVIGGADRFVIVVRDIAERKRIEAVASRRQAEFEAIFNAMTDAVVFVDPQRHILMVNPAFSRIFGYPFAEVVGQTTERIYADPEHYAQQGHERFNPQAVIAKATFETEFRRRDGSTFPGESMGLHVVGGEGELLGYLGIIRDITDRKREEQKRTALEAQLQQAYKMEAIGTMAGGIAHDFNNLLAIIGGNLEMLQIRHQSGRDFTRNMDHLKDATQRATDLVRQILTFSRQGRPELIPLDLVSAVQDTVKLLRSTIPSTIELMCTVDTGPVFIQADRTQLQQVLINLCTNAVHAMAEKGLLQISMHLVGTGQDLPNVVGHPAGRYAKLAISDTGCGMDQNTLSKIFDPFFTTKGVGQGSGMGLALVHGIVEQHGGFITVDSTPGQGSVFNVYFPVTEASATASSSTPEAEMPCGSERLLLVDDEELVATTSSDLLKALGYQVTSMTSSRQALELFRAAPQSFDLVFTDQTMPELTGAELAEAMLRIRPDIPIILTSGHSSRVTEADAKKLGIREFCMKPVGTEKLARVVRKVLDARNLPS